MANTNDYNTGDYMNAANQNSQNTQSGSQTNQTGQVNRAILSEVRKINVTLSKMSQSAMGTKDDRTFKSTNQSTFRDRYNNRASGNRDAGEDRFGSGGGFNFSRSGFTRKFDGIMDKFLDGFEKSLLDGLGVSGFTDAIKFQLSDFAKNIGLNLKDLPEAFGRRMGEDILGSLKSTKLGQQFQNTVHQSMASFSDTLAFMLGRAGTWYQSGSTSKTFGKNSKNDSETSGFSGDTESSQFYSESIRFYNDSREFYEIVTSLLATQGNSALARMSVSDNEADAQFANAVGEELQSKIINKFATEMGLPDISQIFEVFGGGGSEIPKLIEGVTGASESLPMLAEGGEMATEALAGATPEIAALGPEAIAAAIAIELATEALAGFVEAFSKFFTAIGDAADRYDESRDKNLKYEKERMRKDIDALIEQPFKILEDAANRVYEAWDNSVRLINATQGYTKADLQELFAAYSKRLQTEGLASVISSADIMTSLGSVLQSGMSGDIANEFAYIATKLNAAIPTQDFFNYASTYAELASTAMQQGKSQWEAIDYANSQLQLFASNILYANRYLTGGFTTGLQEASSLFESAVQISQAARTGDPSKLGGTLASISAIMGSVAPDLANELVQTVVSTALGGNSREIVALRSLVGINASNTEFLQALARDPQSIFAKMFERLAEMQNMAPEAYMEVAEGISSVFGVSMDAFARVDFNALATAITNMTSDTMSLQENMQLLQAGETTLTSEQLRMKQINEYMLDEGLAYVLDNEVARSIQEHMWDEQMQRELMEATYGVELKGAGLQFLEDIGSTVSNVLDLINPVAWAGKAMQIGRTSDEAIALETDLTNVLKLGKVGTGQARDLYNLRTRNQPLNLTRSYVSMLGGTSLYDMTSNYMGGVAEFFASSSRPFWTDMAGSVGPTGWSKYGSASNGTTGYQGNDALAVSSKYGWGSLSKSSALAFQNPSLAASARRAHGGQTLYSPEASQTAKTASKNALAAKIESMLTDEYMKQFLEPGGGGYEGWAASAKSKGIANMSTALEEAGYSQTEIEQKFQQMSTEAGHQQYADMYADEQDFRDKSREHYTYVQEFYDSQTAPYYEFVKSVMWADSEGAGLNAFVNTKFPNYHTFVKETMWESDGGLGPFIKEHTAWQQTVSTILGSTDQTFNRGINDNVFLIGSILDTWKWKWEQYYIDHIAYNNATRAAMKKIADLNEKSKTHAGDAVYALADGLTDTLTDLNDPQVQTNALLAQILKVLNVIMQQGAGGGSGLSLADTLAGMAMGLTSTNTTGTATKSGGSKKKKLKGTTEV